MSSLYVTLIIGWVVGQIAYAAVSIAILQSKMHYVNYWQGAGAYLKKEFPNFVVAVAALLVILFIVQDYIDVTITRKDLLNKDVLTWKERAIFYQKTAAVFLGAFSQHLLFIAFKRGKKEMQKLNAENAENAEKENQ